MFDFKVYQDKELVGETSTMSSGIRLGKALGKAFKVKGPAPDKKEHTCTSSESALEEIEKDCYASRRFSLMELD